MKNTDSKISISVRDVEKEDWKELENHIGGRSKSQFIRDCIKSQIEKTDTVHELKKEIHELEYQMSAMDAKLKRKRAELADLLETREKNVDNELIIDNILNIISTFNNKYGGISEDKIRSIIRDDFEDSIPADIILNRVHDNKEINIVENVEILHSSKGYNREEEKTNEITEDERKTKILHGLDTAFKGEYQKISNNGFKATVAQVLKDKTVYNGLKARAKTAGLSDDEFEAKIKEWEETYDKK